MTPETDQPVSVGRLALLAIAALVLGGVIAVFAAPVPIGFKVTAWLFVAAIVGASRYRRDVDF